MANEKISQMPAISSFATGDLLPIVDISEVSASDKNKSVTFGALFQNVLGGSAAAPSIAFTGDQNTGIYSPGSDQLAVATNGSGRLFIDASGRVGVGAASPLEELHIASVNPAVLLQETDAGTDQKYWRNRVDNNTCIFEGLTDAFTSPSFWLRAVRSTDSAQIDRVEFATAGSERLRITSAGLVGIGTSSPSAALQVNGSATVTSQANVAAKLGPNLDSDVLLGSLNGNVPFIASQGAYPLDLRTDNASRLRILSNGNVGIGTTSPNELLEVAGNIHLSGADRSIFNRSNNALTFGTNNTERARIDSSGRLLVGTSSTFIGQIQAVASTGGSIGLSRNGASVSVGQIIGLIQFAGNGGDGATVENAADVRCVADGTHAVGDKPGRLVFSTTPSGSATSVERLRISNSGQIAVAGAGSASAPTITKNDDLNTGIFFPAADTIAFAEGGAESARFDSSGRLLVGTSSALSVADEINGAQISDFGIQRSGNVYSSSLALTNFANSVTNARAVTVALARSNGAGATHTLVQSANELGAISFQGSDGTKFIRAANIKAVVDGTAAADSMPGRLVFSTTADGASSPTERLRITSAGNMLFGGTASPASATKAFAIFNGTAPTGSVADGVVLYAEDVSSSSELKVRDEAGNVTTLSPHNFDLIPDGPSEDMAWSYYSERDGKRINVDMLKAIRLLEQISGEKLVYSS